MKAVFFDVGETLVNETRVWGTWADWLGVTRLSFFAALGAVIERGEKHGRVFEMIKPGIDLEKEKRARLEAGLTDGFDEGDIYPDVKGCLRALAEAGYKIGLAGNQPEESEKVLKRMGLPVEVVASSSRWGVAKPAAEFFERVIEAAGCAPEDIAYVGDRLDNDVLPAKKAGMVGVFIRRGPWGYIQGQWADVGKADIRIETLEELAGALRDYESVIASWGL
ncbi:MAG: HAD family hydrolase [Chloroflexi bacterium]|nr:HAD family hydrolase [Chloroflexota bacterium]